MTNEEVTRARARIVGRLARFLESNLAELASDDPLRRELEAVAHALVGAYGLGPLRENANGYLAATEEELRDRMAAAGITPFVMPTPDQAEVLLRGLPFSVEELGACARSAVALWMPHANGDPEILYTAGAIQGAIACAWSR